MARVPCGDCFRATGARDILGPVATQPTTDAPWTVQRLLTWTRDFFERSGVDDPRLAAEVLLAHVLTCRRIELYARFDRIPSEDERSRFRDLVKRAAAQEPVAYLTGEREFFSLKFRVTPEVLIPRPETELLVERVLDYCRQREMQAPRILELGVGSGCILVSVLKRSEQALGTGVDVSATALEIARSNGQRHGVEARLTLVEADWLNLPSGAVPPEKFDVLVSNPPYIAEAGVASLPECIRGFEPRVALTDGADGLTFYRRIAAQARDVLKADGAVFVEVGVGQSAPVAKILAEGGFAHVVTQRDRVSGHERMLQFSPNGRN
ncbi:MAG: peptide chain release factor N(5)-glutamine methyltransferase [Phycisphaerales bacterium]|nr:peptide chain release factor N(5)-glutamine methyltransferase [Phycisphaerales bacterium]